MDDAMMKPTTDRHPIQWVIFMIAVVGLVIADLHGYLPIPLD